MTAETGHVVNYKAPEGEAPECVDDCPACERKRDDAETARAHAAGDHHYCDVRCEAAFPSEALRNGILCRAIPGSPAMLAELERRAAEHRATELLPAAVAERDMQIVRWLGKKAREYRSTGSRQHALQADVIELMASKITSGAVPTTAAGGES